MKIPARFAVLFTVALAFRRPRAQKDTSPDVLKVAVAAAKSNETGTSATPECTCSYYTQPYQQWPLSVPSRAGCVGGCGGTAFQVGHNGGTVRTLSVWTSFWGDLQSMRITYHDGHLVQVGDPSWASDGPFSITFEPGEHIVGNFRLASSWNGGRTTFMAFETTRQSFQAGNPGFEEFLFPTGGAFLAGFTGAVGVGAIPGDIDRLGAIFWKPVTRVQYLNMEYPTLPSLGSPTMVAGRRYCNPNPVEKPTASLGEAIETYLGYSACLTSSVESQFGVNVGISGLIPKIAATGNAGATWGLTSSMSMTNCANHTTKTTRTVNFPEYNIPPETRIDYVFTQWVGRLDRLPFTARLRVTLSDGSTFERTERGTYTGVEYTVVDERWSPAVNPVLSCEPLL